VHEIREVRTGRLFGALNSAALARSALRTAQFRSKIVRWSKLRVNEDEVRGCDVLKRRSRDEGD
jgi:hypothetical protein